MKKTLIYTAVFSVMMMVTGCGEGDNSSSSNNEQNVKPDTSPIKQNKLYSANIDGVSSYYIDDGQNQVSYFHENDKWYGVVENKNGKTNFSFSDDMKEFTAVNNKENRNLEIKQIDDKTISQIIKDSRGIVIESMVYFQEGEQFFVAPLNAGQIDKTKKIDITQAYHDGIQQAQLNNNYSANVKIGNVLNSISDISKSTLNIFIASRSLTRTVDYSCAYGVKDNSDFIKLGKEIVGSIIAAGMIVGGIAVGGPLIVGAVVTAAGALATAEGAAIALGIIIGWNAHASDIDPNNQEAFKKLGITKEEIDNEWKKFLDEAKKCQAEGSVLVNGVCKKEEEPQCLADEILVNGICKKKEPVCLVDEILVDGTCKKKEPVCLADEISENGKCVKQPIMTTGFTKISSTGKKLTDNATEWDCVLDNETGLMWEHKATDGGLRDSKNSYSWFEDSIGFADPRDMYTKEHGYNTIPSFAKPYGYYCNQTLTRCNTKLYTQTINSKNFCGFSDWRLPNKNELVVISKKMMSDRYLANNLYRSYSSSSLYMDNIKASFVWNVSWPEGSSIALGKESPQGVVVVRNSK